MHMTPKTTVLVATSRMMVERMMSSWVIWGNISSGSVRAATPIAFWYMPAKPCQSG